MKSLYRIKQHPQVEVLQLGIDGGAAHVRLQPGKKAPAVVVFSHGGGWEHVSVSYRHRVPTWEEMCQVKDIFWDEDACVVQYHPPKADYINQHPYCLHLWRPTKGGLPRPPSSMVGFKGAGQ
jgi:hypothetical protein